MRITQCVAAVKLRSCKQSKRRCYTHPSNVELASRISQAVKYTQTDVQRCSIPKLHIDNVAIWYHRHWMYQIAHAHDAHPIFVVTPCATCIFVGRASNNVGLTRCSACLEYTRKPHLNYSLAKIISYCFVTANVSIGVSTIRNSSPARKFERVMDQGCVTVRARPLKTIYGLIWL